LGSRHFLDVKANVRQMATNLCLSALGMARTDLCKMPYIFNKDRITVSALCVTSHCACPTSSGTVLKNKCNTLLENFEEVTVLVATVAY
jgi:hypothetical protein